MAVRKNLTKPPHLHRVWYRRRNRVERFFNRFQDFRRFATRYEKTTVSFLVFIQFFAAPLLVLMFVRTP